jgi:tetratricopeptide (TPR) repeat protein
MGEKEHQISEIKYQCKTPWIAAILCFFFGPLGMFYFGWRPAVASMLLFGSVNVFFKYFVAKLTDTPPWVLPTLLFVYAYSGWIYTKSWNFQVKENISNYFTSFRGGLLITSYLIWLNILISFPIIAIFTIVLSYIDSELLRGIIIGLFWLLGGAIWFWLGRIFLLPWMHKANIGKLVTSQPERYNQQLYFGTEKEDEEEGELYNPGDIIGSKYIVYRRLAKGGMGIIYLTYDKQTNSVYALKTFRDEFLADAAAREAFSKEVLLWVKLDKHPYILSANFVEQFSGRLFVVMNYIAPDPLGRTNLADHLSHSGGEVNLAKSLKWAIQFCYGMEHANSHGIKAHRDIKPQNILITQDGTLKITDFGLAAGAEAASIGTSGSLSAVLDGGVIGMSILQMQDREICGTPGYIATEVYEGKEADVRSDIYSFGIVLWQMASGSVLPPFHVDLPRLEDEDNNTHLQRYMEAIRRQQKTDTVPKVNESLDRVIERCLCVEPSGRYSDFKQLRSELEPILKQQFGETVAVPSPEEFHVWNWNNKGLSLASVGLHQEAIDCYDRTIDIDSQYSEPWNNKGISLDSLGRHQEAIDCYAEALGIDPQCVAALNNKGISLGSLGLYQEAIDCYDEALDIDSQYINTWNNKGNCLDSLGRYQEAIDCYDKALDINPRYAETWNNKGVSLNSLGRYREAIDCYDKALDIAPRYTFAWNNKGSSFYSLGLYHEAVNCQDKSLEIDPKNAVAWYNKGHSLRALGLYQEAVGCYDKVLDIDPRNVGAWYNKASSEEKVGRLAEAVNSYQNFIKLAPPQDAQQMADVRQRLREFKGR